MNEQEKDLIKRFEDWCAYMKKHDQTPEAFDTDPRYQCVMKAPPITEADKRQLAELMELTEATFPLTDDQYRRLYRHWMVLVRISSKRVDYCNPLNHLSFPA